MININMRCIEIMFSHVVTLPLWLININMRCIEMLTMFNNIEEPVGLTLT